MMGNSNNSQASNSAAAPAKPKKPAVRISNVSLAVFIGITFFTGLYDKGMNSGIPLYYDDLGYSAASGGAFVAVFTVASMIGRLLGGQVTDHFSHYRVLLASLGAMVIGAAIPAIPMDNQDLVYWVLMVCRVIQGIGFALAANTVTVAVMGTSKKKDLGKRVGLAGAGTSGGTMLGAVVAVFLLDDVGFEGFFLFYTVLIIAAMVAVIILNRSERKHKEEEDSEGDAKADPDDKHLTLEHEEDGFEENPSTGDSRTTKVKKTMKELIAPYLMPQVFPYLLVGFARRLPKGFCVAFVLIYAKLIGITGGAAFFVAAGASTLACRLTLGKIFDSNKTWIMLPMLAVEVVGFVIFALAPNFITLIVSGIGYGITIGTISPFLKTLTAKHSPKEHWGVVNGELYFFSDLGKAIGAYIGGLVIDAVGKELIPEIAIVFTVAPLVIAAIALIVDRHQSKKQAAKQ